MTQLNIGNKGCKNLEGKQESLSFLAGCFLSLFPVQRLDIFGSSFLGNSCPVIWMDCAYNADALAIDKSLSSETLSKVKGSKGARLGSEEASLILQKTVSIATPWMGMCSVIT